VLCTLKKEFDMKHTVQSIIDKSGGKDAVCEIIPSLKPDTLRSWKRIGIPEKYWDRLIDMHKTRLTVNDLHKLNTIVRGGW
jgi:hypothetical protein